MTDDLLNAAIRQAKSMNVLPEHTIIMALADEIERLRSENADLRAELDDARYWEDRGGYRGG